jgi:hypothetical protein
MLGCDTMEFGRQAFRMVSHLLEMFLLGPVYLF